MTSRQPSKVALQLVVLALLPFLVGASSSTLMPGLIFGVAWGAVAAWVLSAIDDQGFMTHAVTAAGKVWGGMGVSFAAGVAGAVLGGLRAGTI